MSQKTTFACCHSLLWLIRWSTFHQMGFKAFFLQSLPIPTKHELRTLRWLCVFLTDALIGPWLWNEDGPFPESDEQNEFVNLSNFICAPCICESSLEGCMFRACCDFACGACFSGACAGGLRARMLALLSFLLSFLSRSAHPFLPS